MECESKERASRKGNAEMWGVKNLKMKRICLTQDKIRKQDRVAPGFQAVRNCLNMNY